MPNRLRPRALKAGGGASKTDVDAAVYVLKERKVEVGYTARRLKQALGEDAFGTVREDLQQVVVNRLERKLFDLLVHQGQRAFLLASAFQQLEIDYVTGESHRELLPNSSGSAAILRIFGVTREGHSICSQVHGFEPYFYIGCPSGMGPDDITLSPHTRGQDERVK